MEETTFKRNYHYHKDLLKFFRYNIEEGKTILEIGSGTGYLLAGLNPLYGVGVDISDEMTLFARKMYPSQKLKFVTTDAESINVEGKFDYIVISDTLALVGDVQQIFHEIKANCTENTRILMNTYNPLWRPVLRLAEVLKLKSPSPGDNWLTMEDLETLLYIEDFQVVKRGMRFIFPFNIPYLTDLINTYIAPLPLINRFCLVQTLTARPYWVKEKECSVSVIVPAKNEEGNIDNLLTRLPSLGLHPEVIFVEGGSTDGTEKKIKEAIEKYKDKDIVFVKQTSKGKADAVRLGFQKATKDILMILDADLSVPPEDLLRFYNVIKENKGEFVYGSRLVYAMQDGAMQLLNMFGNKFFSSAFSYLLDTPIKDTLCGTKVLSRDNYLRIQKNADYFGNHDPFGDFDLILGAAKLNLKFVEIPVRYKSREYGSTNISRFKNGLELFKMLIFCLQRVKFY